MFVPALLCADSGGIEIQPKPKENKMRKEVITEIVKRLRSAYKLEKKTRKQWVKLGLPESTAPSSIGLIGTEKTGYECTRCNWWRALECDKIANGLDYLSAVHEVERTKIKNLSFGS